MLKIVHAQFTTSPLKSQNCANSRNGLSFGNETVFRADPAIQQG